MNEVVTKDKLVDDFKDLVADFKVISHDADILLRETAGQLGDKARDAREKLERGIKVARDRMGDIQKQSVDQAKIALKATDEFVHDHPWQSIGVSFVVGALLGVLVGRR